MTRLFVVINAMPSWLVLTKRNKKIYRSNESRNMPSRWSRSWEAQVLLMSGECFKTLSGVVAFKVIGLRSIFELRTKIAPPMCNIGL
jgi:hypothetical protein